MTMILEREEIKEETFVSEFDFSVFVMLERGRMGGCQESLIKLKDMHCFFCFGLFASSVIKSLKT